jgi:glycosyltransferase involved in cell wall biosynthesis
VKLLLYTEEFPQPGSRAARHSGIGRYCHDLATGLAEAGAPVTVLAPHEGPVTQTAYRVVPLPRYEGRVVARARAVRRALAGGAGHLLLAGDPVAHRVLAFGGAPQDIPRAPVFYGTELRALAPSLSYAGVSPLGLLRRAAWRRYVEAARYRIVISRYAARELASALGRPVASVTVYPAVAPEFLAAAPAAPRAGDGLRLLAIGRISERKNQLGVARMLAAARAAGLDVRCAFLGNVDAREHESYHARLRAYVADSGLGAAVTLLPQATDEEKLAALDDCDAVVALSRTVGASVEGFGITVLEAAARARPAIVSTEGGLPETIVEGNTGFAVGVDDEPAFVQAVRALLAPERRAAMGEAALRRVRAGFTTAAMARQFLEGVA